MDNVLGLFHIPTVDQRSVDYISILFRDINTHAIHFVQKESLRNDGDDATTGQQRPERVRNS